MPPGAARSRAAGIGSAPCCRTRRPGPTGPPARPPSRSMSTPIRSCTSSTPTTATGGSARSRGCATTRSRSRGSSSCMPGSACARRSSSPRGARSATRRSSRRSPPAATRSPRTATCTSSRTRSSRSASSELIHRSADILERVSGRRPRGWRGPLYTFSDRTAEFLADEGYAYHSGLMGDDVPYVLSTVWRRARRAAGRLGERRLAAVRQYRRPRLAHADAGPGARLRGLRGRARRRDRLRRAVDRRLAPVRQRRGRPGSAGSRR